MLQYHGTSTDNPRVLIVAPTGVASININGITIHYALNSNTLASLRNKFSEVQLIIVGAISMLSKKVFYQIHQRLIKIFDCHCKEVNVSCTRSLSVTSSECN